VRPQLEVWSLDGNPQQNSWIAQTLAVCDFPFEQLAPSLAKEGRDSISVTWADLSGRGTGELGSDTHDAGDEHDHDHTEVHTVERVIDGRLRVLGLFYLPPYTKIVLDNSLEFNGLCAEVFMAEAAHAVDYHYMVERGMRKQVWNAMHAGTDQDVDGDVPESGDIGHDHSWFDGPAGYRTWAGEGLMAAFTRAFAPSVPVTMELTHRANDDAVAEIREALIGKPPLPATAVYRGKTKVYHDGHRRIAAVEWYPTSVLAKAAGLKPCKTCKPA